MPSVTLSLIPGIGPTEMIAVGVIAVLLFGRNLPEVARKAGKSFTEFKRGMSDLQDEMRVSLDTLDSPPTGRQKAATTTALPEPDRDEPRNDEGYDDSDFDYSAQAESAEEQRVEEERRAQEAEERNEA